MKYLYVDNFRGFTDTYIPLKNVNFFVGENSTGKTSILSLIALLREPRFWLLQDFNVEESGYGHFDNIVSIGSENKKYFRIGVIETSLDQNGDISTEMFLMRFAKSKGMPVLSRYNYVFKKKQIRLIFTDNKVWYKVDSMPAIKESLNQQNQVMEIFQSWVRADEELSKGYKGYKELIAKLKFPRRRVLMHIDILTNLIFKGDEEIPIELHPLQYPLTTLHLSWLAPVRSKPKRIYDGYTNNFTPEGDHVPNLIKGLLSKPLSKANLLDFLQTFGKDSGLFESLDVRKFGKESIAPFELRAVLNGHPLRTVDVGYGISQVLPVVIELFAGKPGTAYAVQQPEVHLHPKAQAALGSLFYSLADLEERTFFIETHSDYIIDRFRLHCRKREDDKIIQAQVLFFERVENGNRVYPIEILPNGDYSEDQPASFREFFIHEELSLLGL